MSVPGKERSSEESRLADISEARSNESDTDSVVPATISALRRVQLIDGRRPSDGGEASSGDPTEPAPPATVQVSVPPPPSTVPPEPQPQYPRPLLLTKPRGLPSNPRGRLEISKPIPPPNGVLNERTTFERPRPAPLILKDLKDNSSIPTDVVQGDRF